MTLNRSIIAGLFVIVLFVAGCEKKQDSEKQNDSGPRSVIVDAKPVENRTVNETIDVVGSLQARERTVVTTEIAGKVETIHFEEGTVISREMNGTGSAPVLVELDDDLLQAKHQGAEAQLEVNRSSLNQAQDDFQRQKKLRENGATTEAEFTRAKHEYQRAKARVEQTKAQLAETSERLSKTKIRAPFAGELGERHVSPGSYLNPGDPIVEVVQQDPIEVRFDVPEKFQSKLRTGLTVQLDIAAYPEREYEGTVFYVAPSARSDTRTIRVKARLSNSNRELNPGMFANVRLVTETRENASVVPDTAVVPRDDRYFVYVVEDGKAVRKEIQLGQRYPGSVEVRNGLEGSETVVTSGLQKVNDGVPVDVR